MKANQDKNIKMKKVNYQTLVSKSTLHGASVGVVTAVIIILLGLDSPVLREGRNGIQALFHFFPASWAIISLPVVFGIFAYYLSARFTQIIKRQSFKLSKEANRTRIVLNFIENLRQGKLDVPFKFHKNDPTGRALLRFREYMIKTNTEQEQRRIEEEQRNWVTHGLAQFGEILRRSSDNLEELSYEILRYLISYMKVNQGGVFLVNTSKSGEKYFEMTSCIAFDRRKYADKKVNWGEGLLGRCGLEKETIYLTDVPHDYIHITSGLGGANPGTILLVPLKTNDELYGVIELASFQKLQPFEIELVEKSAESIASTIAMVRNNIQTNKLLRETQIQAEKMSQQEEELRQNLEEMRATQEESDRRETELKGILDAIGHAAISCEFDTEGNLLSVNENFLNAFKYKPEEVENQNLKIFFFKEDLPELDRILADLQQGRTFRGRVRRRTKPGNDIYLLSTYSPVVNHNNEILKILSLEFDVTETVKMEEALKQSKEELGKMLESARNEVKAQFAEVEAIKIRNEKTLEGALDAIITINNEGVLDFFNAAAEKLWGYDRSEVLGQDVSMLFSKEAIKTNDFVAAFVTKGKEKIVGERREIPIRNKYGEEIPVLMLLSEAKVGEEYSHTAFIQNIEVELF